MNTNNSNQPHKLILQSGNQPDSQPLLRLRSTVLAISIAGFLIGLWLGHQYFELKFDYVLIMIGLTLAFRRSKMLLPLLLISSLSLGIWRGHQSSAAYHDLTSQFGQKITITGFIADDPSTSDKSFVTLSMGRLMIQDQSIPGRIRVTSPYAKLKRGYKIAVTGKIKPSLGSATAELFAKPTILSTDQNWLEHWRQRFFAGTRTALPEPLASFALGLLVGTRALLPKTFQDQLTLIGLSHLVAVSGYNLTILVNAAYRPLRRLSKYLATSTSLWLILGFLVISGFSASIIRASIVASLILLSNYYGAKPKPLTLIAIAAGITAAWRPQYLWNDLGWQLSFLAFFGILVLAPMVQARFINRPHWVKSLLIESMSAQIMTFPLIALIFGRLSLISPVTNFLILPLVPAAMLLSFIAGLAGIIIPAFSGWLSWPAVLLMRFILAIINWFAKIKWASINLRTSSFEVIALYLLILLVVTILFFSIHRQSATKVDTAILEPSQP